MKYLRTRGNKWAYRCFLWPPLVQLWLGIDFHTAHKHRVHIFCQVFPRACNTVMEKNKNKFIYFTHKVEKVLKGSLNSISSPLPSVKIQIVSGKVCLRLGIKAKHWWVLSTTFANEKFVDITQQCFALLQVNFPANNLNFDWRWRWWNRIKAIFLNLLFVLISSMWSLEQKSSLIC